MSFAACAPISSGGEFLRSSLAFLDCAGREIGSTGYTALSQPGSIPSQLMLTSVTLFIAWHGIRMMFGRVPDMGDAVLAAAKIGLVLMLVTSWPAVRTLFAAPAFAGSTELVAETRIHGPLPLEDHMQRADDGIVALTKKGTGKLDIRAGRTSEGQPASSEFAGIALTDDLALGLGRLCFLVGALMSLGLLKLLTGVMISALPIFAGLLLFDSSRSLFWGWLRMIFALFVAGFAIPLILSAEISLIEPWLARAIAERSASLATPSAPTELLAMTASFLLILAGSTMLIVRTCFTVDFSALATRVERWRRAEPAAETAQLHSASGQFPSARPTELSRAESLALSLGRSERAARANSIPAEAGPSRLPNNDIGQPVAGMVLQTSGRRRTRQRMALSHARRNQR